MPADEAGAASTPRARPRFLPKTGRQRLCLVLLLAFTMLKGMVWGVTIPYFWGPDEDYHFIYVERLTVQHELPDPKQDFYPQEYWDLSIATRSDDFGTGARSVYEGDPKAQVRAFENVPRSDRVGSSPGRGVGVVHPPLYYVAGAAVNDALGDTSLFTRIEAIRFLSAAFGVLAVYFAWILAAQVLRRFREQIFAAFLLSTQPVFNYLSGIVNHDTALIAFSTAAIAMMLFLLRTAPRARQGAWLGGALVLALMVKGTALALLPVAGLAYLGQWLVFKSGRREVVRSALLAAGIVVALTGWWYVRAKIVYGSFTGATTDYSGLTAASGLNGVGPLYSVQSPLDYISWAWDWIELTYRSYWWHYLFFESPPTSSGWYWIPIGLGAVGVAGIARALWARRRALLAPDDALARQVVLVLVSLVAVTLPFMAVDIARRKNGVEFFAPGGRYLLPAFAGCAAIWTAGLCALFRGRALTIALSVIGVIALGFDWRVYEHNWVVRYFGDIPWGARLDRLTFDKPEFVTPTSLKASAVVAALLLAGFAFTALWPGRDRPRKAPDNLPDLS